VGIATSPGSDEDLQRRIDAFPGTNPDLREESTPSPVMTKIPAKKIGN
jgi:hypothetical protein